MMEDMMKKRMMDAGTLLVAVKAPEEEEGEGEEYEERADTEAMAKEAMDSFMAAVKAGDTKEALSAFSSLMHLCPMADEYEGASEMDKEPK